MHSQVVHRCTLGLKHIAVGSRRSYTEKQSSCRATGDKLASASLHVPTFFAVLFALGPELRRRAVPTPSGAVCCRADLTRGRLLQ